MTLNDRAVAVIRTAVPVLIGSLLAWLTSQIPAVAQVLAWIDTNLGIVLGAPAVELLKLGAVAVVITAYYAVVRWMSPRWPWLEALLGSKKTPAVYTLPNAFITRDHVSEPEPGAPVKYLGLDREGHIVEIPDDDPDVAQAVADAVASDSSVTNAAQAAVDKAIADQHDDPHGRTT